MDENGEVENRSSLGRKIPTVRSYLFLRFIDGGIFFSSI